MAQQSNNSPVKKSPAQQQADLVRQIVMQFDIQTHVKKMTVEAMDAYMRRYEAVNTQAFDYIEKWEKKFLNFEQRLVKAENYYRNIQTNINSKIQVTNNLNERLEKFAVEFWEGMKESAESLAQMRKNYLNLVREAGNQTNTLKGFEREQLQLSAQIAKVDAKYEDQIVSVLHRINDIDGNVHQKNSERRRQNQELLIKVTEARSLMDSKIEVMTEMAKNLNLYVEEKQSINSRIQTLFEEMSNRVLKSDIGDLRKYIDSQAVAETKRVNLQLQKLDKCLQEEYQARTDSDVKINQELKIMRQYNLKEFQIIHKNIQEKNSNTLTLIQKNKEEMSCIFEQKQTQIYDNLQMIKNNRGQIEKIEDRLQEIDGDLVRKNDRIVETQSNITAINEMIGKIQSQNLQRTQEMAELRIDTKQKGDLGDQMKVLTEKVIAHDDYLRFLESKVKDNEVNLREVQNKSQSQLKLLEQSVSAFITKTQEIHKKSSSNVKKLYQELLAKIQATKSTVTKYVDNQIGNKIDSIKQKFQFLEIISKQLREFKETFSKQLEMNDRLNVQIKEKMDRIFSMFTKLKSDVYLRFQTHGQDILKNSSKIREILKTLGEVTGFMGLINQLVTLIMAVELQQGFRDQPLTFTSEDNSRGFKIASILEGWVLQIEEVADKAKYRGQFLNRKAVLQGGLEYLVKYTDRIKGGIIENGKQMFNKIYSNNEEYLKSRKRSISRRKNRMSELPKVYR